MVEWGEMVNEVECMKIYSHYHQWFMGKNSFFLVCFDELLRAEKMVHRAFQRKGKKEGKTNKKKYEVILRWQEMGMK